MNLRIRQKVTFEPYFDISIEYRRDLTEAFVFQKNTSYQGRIIDMGAVNGEDYIIVVTYVEGRLYALKLNLTDAYIY